MSVSPLEDNRIVIAGGSGFLGISLAHHLAERGFSPVILSRNVPKVSGPWRHRPWDGRTLGEWRDELNRAAVSVKKTTDCQPIWQDDALMIRYATLGAKSRKANRRTLAT
ncbi:MAG: hypothetical protein ACQESR_20420 [Planctomycetota bacterium]